MSYKRSWTKKYHLCGGYGYLGMGEFGLSWLYMYWLEASGLRQLVLTKLSPEAERERY